MAKAYQCDRCGELYEEYATIKPKFAVISYIYNGISRPKINHMDLCPNCQEKLKEFIIEGGFYDEESE